MNGLPHILIADDDYQERYIISTSFDEIGYKDAIMLVEDGILLIEYLNTIDCSHVELIILDMNMPRMNGTETLKTLKNDSRYKQITVVMFSTSVNQLEKECCIQYGAAAYITKPDNYLGYLATCRKFISMLQ